MNISDLNYIESANVEVSGGWFFKKGANINVNFDDKKEIDIKERVDIQKSLYTESFVFGTSALAQGSASAYGANSNAEAFSATETKEGYSSEAIALSVSQSMGAYNFGY